MKMGTVIGFQIARSIFWSPAFIKVGNSFAIL